MKFTLTIELGNVGMLSRNDVAIKLKEVAAGLTRWSGSVNPDSEPTSGPIRDVSGNRVGKWEFKEE